MTKRLTILITLCSLAATTSDAVAAEAAVAVDRSQLTLGESFHVKIQVRKSAGKPLVQPPKVAGCRIEVLGTAHFNAGGRGASPAAKRTPGSITNVGPLVDAIGKLESDTQKALSDPGLGNGPLNQEALDMLRATRQQALEALQGPNNTEYVTTFRVTPERSGVLTLPSFIVESGGRTLLTKPMEITVEEKQVAAAKPPAAKQEQPAAPAVAATTQAKIITLPAPYEAKDLPGWQTHPGAMWPWLAGVLAAPFGILAGFCTYRLWQRRRRLTAPERERRSEALAARRELGSHLRPDADPEALGEALTNYLRSRWNLPPGEVTPAEAARSLEASGVAAELAERVGLLLDTCFTVRFAPGGVAVLEKDLVTEARELIAKLDRLGR